MEILVADDEVNIAELYQNTLEAKQHHVVITNDGEECLKVYHEALEGIESGKSYFDVVILDYNMPKKDGLEVAKEILAANPYQRIIFASAYVKDILVDAVKELKQPVELLQKPFNVSFLVEKIEAYPSLSRKQETLSK